MAWARACGPCPAPFPGDFHPKACFASGLLWIRHDWSPIRKQAAAAGCLHSVAESHGMLWSRFVLQDAGGAARVGARPGGAGDGLRHRAVRHRGGPAGRIQGETPPPVPLPPLTVSMPRWLCSSKVAEVTGTAQSKSVWVVLVQGVALGCKKAVLAY